jgi:hypothetical protein
VELPAITRRVLLRRSLQAAGALATLPGFALACAPADVERAPSDLRVLDAAQWSVLDVVADTFVPRGGAFPLGARDVDLARRIDSLLVGEPPAVLRGLVAALFAIEWAAPLATGRFARFSRLDAEARTAAVEALCRSRVALLRDVYAGLKQLCSFSFYAIDASWAATGYDGPWVKSAATP